MLQREMAATDSMAHHHQKTKKTYSGAYPDHSVEHRHTKPHFIRMWGPWFIAVVLTIFLMVWSVKALYIEEQSSFWKLKHCRIQSKRVQIRCPQDLASKPSKAGDTHTDADAGAHDVDAPHPHCHYESAFHVSFKSTSDGVHYDNIFATRFGLQRRWTETRADALDFTEQFQVGEAYRCWIDPRDLVNAKLSDDSDSSAIHIVHLITLIASCVSMAWLLLKCTSTKILRRGFQKTEEAQRFLNPEKVIDSTLTGLN